MVSVDLLREFLVYDPSSGKLYWRERTPKNCACSSQWNSAWAGKEALTATKHAGHLHGLILRKSIMAHRAAWAIFYGEWPNQAIDHINGNPADNRISNLRVVDALENAANRRPNRGKASGLPHGVGVKKNGRFFAQIQRSGRNHHLGYFSTPEAASAAYLAAKSDMGFHPNHGVAILDALIQGATDDRNA